MAQEIVNETQNLSYTNQDFSSIYPEVLNLIKQLTYKWDPSISDESDPGVILVKLSAIIADKCNYNIDKSILEAFPLSVTQDSNARQLYEQLGYYMDWYESARTNVSISYISKNNTDTIETYKIPRFTIITDKEATHNYALVGTEDANGIVVSDTLISSDGKPVLVTAIEGTPVKYTYQGESIITSHMVDPITRRLYFTTSYVSQNGVFINNVGQDNYASWKRVNNLYEQTYNELRYMFGFDSKSNLCYIEFPENYAELFGSGIEITYMIIDESYENLPSQQLTQFLSPVRVVLSETDYIELDSGNTKINNFTASYGHKNKETINEAYINYRRTVGTFKTLITLRDYLNFIRDREAEICSNAFVCDRTNDVQSTYKIMSRQNDLDTLIVKVEQIVDRTSIESAFDYRFIKTQDETVSESKMYYSISVNNELEKIKNPTGNPKEQGWYELEGVEPKTYDALSPFSLKFYLLRNAVSLNSKSAYDETFEMMYESPDVDTLLEDTAHLEHTYENILPLGENTYKETKDKNFSDTKSYYYFEEDTKTYRLITDTSSYEVTYTPITIDLDDPENPYKVGDIINPTEKNWFEEINQVTEETTDTFARVGVFEGSDREGAFFIQANITPESYPKESGWFEYSTSTETYSMTTDKRPVIGKMYYERKQYLESHIGDPSQQQYKLYELDVEAMLPHIVFFKNIYPVRLDISTYEPQGADTQNIIMSNVITALFENTNSEEIEFGEDVSLEYLVKIVENSDDRIRTASFSSLDYVTKAIYYSKEDSAFKSVTLDSDMSILEPEDYRSEESILKARFKKDILAKSILAGTTQLIVPDSTFTYHLSHKFLAFMDNVASITSEAIVDFQDSDASTSYVTDDDGVFYIRKTYTLKENETVTIYRPSLTDVQQFLSGARFEYLLREDIDVDQSYELSKGEYIIFYTPDTNDSGVTTGYNVYAYTTGTIIRPEVRILSQKSLTALTKYVRNRIISYFETHRGLTEYNTYTNNSTYMTEIRNSANIASNTIENTEAISIQQLNTVELTTDDKFKFFWVLNNPTYSNDDNLKSYTLFDEYDSDKEQDVDTNTYTLKSGEYFYYTDADEKDLSILGPGTIITRNCGVITDTVNYNEINSSFYFESCDVVNTDLEKKFNYITNSDGHNNPLANGMYVVKGTPEPYSGDRNGSPEKLGLYETNGEYYFLSTNDTFGDKDYFERTIFERSLDTDIQPGVVYYWMLTHKNANWFEKSPTVNPDGTISYNYISDPITTPVFEEIILKDGNELINPKELGYYEIITYNNQIIEDSYRINDSAIVAPHERFANTLDETVLSRNILSSMSAYSTWDITNPNSYRTIYADEMENIPTTDVLGLKIPTYTDYYKLVGGEYVLVEDVNYLSNPSTSGWYKKREDGSYEKAIYDKTPEIISVSNSSIATILKDETPSFGMNFYRQCYFFSPNLYAHSYYYDINKNSVELSASDIIFGSDGDLGSPLSRLMYFYDNITSEYSGGNDWITDISNNRWSELYTYYRPNTWAVPEMTENPVGQWTSAPSTEETKDKYIRLKASDIVDYSSLLDAIYPAFTINGQKEADDFLDADFFIPAIHYTTLGIEPSTESPLSYYQKTGEFIKLDSDLKLARLFPRGFSLDLDKYQVYYLPRLYRPWDLVAYSTSKYYRPKDYVTKSFGIIDAWNCSAIDNNKIAEDPIKYISSLWRNMQYNTSITITESELWSFASGDSIIVEAEEVTDNVLNWPVFSNNEITIDTDHFNLGYQRNGSDVESLDNLTISGYSWRGYSSLLLNTSSNNGQKLSHNHTLTLYGPHEEGTAGQDEPILILSGEPGSEITFQLKYPVANKSGTFIDVASTDTLGESVLNSIYIFKALINGDFYKYTTDVYDTYLYFNSYLPDPASGDPMVRKPREIEIPVGIPWGNYILPITSKSGINLRAEFSQSSLFNDEEVDINLIPVADTSVEGPIKINPIRDKILLHSFVDESRTVFEGDKFQFIQLDLERYVPINLPAYISQMLEASPADLGWYEVNQYGEYSPSENENTGAYLIEQISEMDILGSDNPKANYWYEMSGSDYILTEDESPVSDKDYYRDLMFFIPINKVDSKINFSITKKNVDKDEPYEDAVTYIIKDVFRFSKNELLGDESYDILLNHMKRLDENEDYNFTFVPNSNDLITNPLEPRAFWNHNHIYRPFTIAQLDFDNIDYKFTNSK